MYDGTLATKGPWQALVTFQQLIILADRNGEVDMTPEAISRRTTIPLEIIEHGIKALEERSRLEKQTQLFIETPYRNGSMLEALAASCAPDTLICLATDLTLPTESIRTQSTGKWRRALSAGEMPAFHKKPTVFLLLAQ